MAWVQVCLLCGTDSVHLLTLLQALTLTYMYPRMYNGRRKTLTTGDNTNEVSTLTSHTCTWHSLTPALHPRTRSTEAHLHLH